MESEAKLIDITMWVKHATFLKAIRKGQAETDKEIDMQKDCSRAPKSIKIMKFVVLKQKKKAKY